MSRKKKKLMLFIPNSSWDNMRRWSTTPLSILILIALLRDEFELHVLDANGQDYSDDKCTEVIKDVSPDAVLVSALSFEYASQCHKAIALVKEVSRDIITIMGGVHPTIVPEEVLEDRNVDYVFMRHAEGRLNNVLRTIFSGNKALLKEIDGLGFRDTHQNLVINPIKKFRADVKEIVKPDYTFFDLSPYFSSKDNLGSHHLSGSIKIATIITSYGCPNHCVFCANPLLCGRKVVFRPIEDILREIEYLIERYDIGQFIFIDDCFLLRRARVVSLFNAFIERGYSFKWKTTSVAAWLLDLDLLKLMKKSGCVQISIAVESGVQRVLTDIIRKPLKLEIVPNVIRMCREVGLNIGANFVVGFPGETWNEIRETFRYAEACDFDVVHFHVAVPYPKTDLYTIAKSKGYLDPNFDFKNVKFIGHAQGYITTDEFTPNELMILRAYEWDRINFKSKEKNEKVAQMYNMSVDVLQRHRRNTRLNLGVIKENIKGE